MDSGLADGIDWGFWLAITVWWVVELGLGPFQLVLMGIALELSVLLAETPTGVVADLVSRKRSMVIAQVVMGIGILWSVSSHNYWVILPAQAIFGVGWTFRSGADTAWVTDELKGSGAFDDDDLEGLLLRKHRAGIAVALVAISATIIIGTLTSVRWAVVVMGLLQIAIGAYFWLAMSEDHFTPGRDSGSTFFGTLREGLTVVATRPRLRALVLVILVLDMGAEAFDRLGVKHFLDRAAISDDSLAVLGLLFLGLALMGLGANFVATRVLRGGYGVARLAVLLLGVAALGGFLAAMTNIVVVIAVGLMLQDSTREALRPVLDGWANRDAPSEVRATVHSLMSQTTAVGELIGGLTLGVVAEFTSIQTVLVIAGCSVRAVGPPGHPRRPATMVARRGAWRLS